MRTPWPQARRIARDVAKPLNAVTLPLAAAGGAALAAPLEARIPQPLCDIAAMDGYAVAGPGPWLLIDRILAGDVRFTMLLRGQASEIATGAPVPSGTEAVIPYEQARRDGKEISGTLPERPHIRRRGEDFGAGQVLVAAGTVVNAPVAGLAAGLGHDVLRVYQRPRVRAVLTGNELLLSGTPRPGRVRDAIGPMLPGLVRAAGGEVIDMTPCHDDAAALTHLLESADEDVLAVCGATSAGAADHLRTALARMNATVIIEQVACRPGHPQLLAALPGGRFLVGLPGNPYAALVAALTLLSPMLGSLAGRAVPPAVTAQLKEAPAPHPRDTLLVAACWHDSGVVPVGNDRPGSLWAPAVADVLAVLPPDWMGGDVELLHLPGA
ncbi:MAG TPA: molybdopterin molybdotransferase MoeA [Streptosporangiaceae bacterium]|nr:molybdopterin molybdotransferase MoeA [Streptosporangiaceae bacterium]